MAGEKRPIDHLLDLVVYAPIGFVMNLEEVVPQLVEKGHQQVQMARMFGQFAVDTGTKELRRRLEQLAARGPRTGPGSGAAPAGGAGAAGSAAAAGGEPGVAERAVAEAAVPVAPGGAAAEASAGAGPEAGGPATAAARAAAPEGAAGAGVPSSADLPIPDYDSLAASQVVPRLEGLTPEERDLVRRYESAHRRRKTILSKLAQLG